MAKEIHELDIPTIQAELKTLPFENLRERMTLILDTVTCLKRHIAYEKILEDMEFHYRAKIEHAYGDYARSAISYHQAILAGHTEEEIIQGLADVLTNLKKSPKEIQLHCAECLKKAGIDKAKENAAPWCATKSSSCAYEEKGITGVCYAIKKILAKLEKK